MIHAFKLFTGKDNQTHVIEGSINEDIEVEVIAIHFKETPAKTGSDWHLAPVKQYVITLSGTLQFITRDGEKFILKPGDVLVAEDDIGSGHRWQLIDNEPWRRSYVVLRPGSKDSFVAG